MLTPQEELDQLHMSQIETDNGLAEQIYEYEEGKAEYEFEMNSENAWLRAAEYCPEAQDDLYDRIIY